MVLKYVGFFILLAFINTITYFPQSGMGINNQKVTSGAVIGDSMETSAAEFDGDTLLECLLDDVFELPLQETEEEPNLFIKILSFLGNLIHIPVILLLVSLLPLLALLSAKLVFGPFHSSKLRHLPGYYSFLFRLKPF